MDNPQKHIKRKNTIYSLAKACKSRTTSPYTNLSDEIFITSIPRNISLIIPSQTPKRLAPSTKTLVPDLHYLFSKVNRRKKIDTDHDKTFRRHTVELRDADMEHWLLMTNRFPKERWCIKERRILRQLFDRIDEDGSGEIDIDELANALLSSGIAKTLSEVIALVNSVEDSKISFKTFLSITRPNNKRSKFKDDDELLSVPDAQRSHTKNGRKAKIEEQNNPISRLHAIQQQNGYMDMKSTLMFKRRKLLIDATMGETLRQELALESIEVWKSEFKEGKSSFKRTSDLQILHKHMNKLQEEKKQFISAIQIIIAKETESAEFF